MRIERPAYEIVVKTLLGGQCSADRREQGALMQMQMKANPGFVWGPVIGVTGQSASKTYGAVMQNIDHMTERRGWSPVDGHRGRQVDEAGISERNAYLRAKQEPHVLFKRRLLQLALEKLLTRIQKIPIEVGFGSRACRGPFAVRFANTIRRGVTIS